MLQIGNDKIKEIYVGSDKIKEVYHGSEKVWQSAQVGYWVHKNTGVKTYFGLDDPSIVDGIMSPPSWRYDCSEVQLPLGVTGLGDNCFYNCTSLTSIILPESVTNIGSACFRGCALTSITIPESVTIIGTFAFYACYYLILATVLPAIPPTLGIQVFNNVNTSFNIKVRSPYVDDYKTATNWTAYASKISAI